MKKNVLLIFIVGFVFFGNTIAQVPTDGLVGYWPFSGNANDESGNNNHGNVHGATLTMDRLGKPLSAYSFDGANDYITLLFEDVIFNEFTVSGWFQFNNFDNKHAVGSYTNNGEGWAWKILNGNINYHTGGNNFFVSSIALDYSKWYHVVITHDGNMKNIYINGLVSDSSSTGTIVKGGSVIIGAIPRYLETKFNWDGEIDDIRIYNRALIEQEILELYNEGKQPSITVHPQSKTICKSQNSTLLVSASGVSLITYQWQKDGTNIPSAVDSIYIIANAQLSDAGNYTCIATNSFGSDTSDVAIITVQSVSESTIMGPDEVAEWQNVTYSVTEQTGHTYDFSVTGGNKIANTSNSITVTWGTTGWGHIKLVETNSVGCVGDTVDLEVAVGDIIGINDNRIAEREFCFPNPVHNFLYLSKKQKVEIYSLQGKSLMSDYTNKIDVSDLINGLYILRVNNSFGKFIKQ